MTLPADSRTDPAVRPASTLASARRTAAPLLLAALLASAVALPGAVSGLLVGASEPEAVSPSILDGGEPGTSYQGAWTASQRGSPYGPNAWYAKRSASYTFAPKLPAGSYRVYLRWTRWDKLSTSVPVVVESGGVRSQVNVNQRLDGSGWNLLGTFQLDQAATLRLIAGSRGWTCADAAMFEPVSLPPSPPPPDPDTPPLPPRGLAAAGGDGRVNLDWLDSSEADLAGYRVYRARQGESQYALLAADQTESQYTDGSALSGETCGYVVTAVDLAGQESEPSLEAMGGPLAPPAPQSVTLAWDPPAVNADGTPLLDLAGFKLYQGAEAGQYRLVRTLGSVNQCVVDSLSPGTYSFVVTAVDVSGNESAFSQPVSTTLQ